MGVESILDVVLSPSTTAVVVLMLLTLLAAQGVSIIYQFHGKELL